MEEIDLRKQKHKVYRGWEVWEADEGLYLKSPDSSAEYSIFLNAEIFDRIIEMIKFGPQPKRYDGTWNVKPADDGWGLEFELVRGSGGSHSGLAPNPWAAFMDWYNIVRPRTKDEQVVLDLIELENLLTETYPDKGYGNILIRAIASLNEKISKV